MRFNSFHQLRQSRLDKSTKPFAARGGKTRRCSRCQVALTFCICDVEPSPSDEVAALLLLSENEVLKPSNTGRLILDVVDDSYAYQWSRTSPDPNLLTLLQDERYCPVILFPQEYVDDPCRLLASSDLETASPESPLPSQLASDGKKLLLIFLDGSWREARRMFRQSPYLNLFPVYSIQPEKMSEYLMRKSQNPNHLATAEVASVAFLQLGCTELSQRLLLWFEAFREAYLLSKSRGEGDVTRSAFKKMDRYLHGGESLNENV